MTLEDALRARVAILERRLEHQAETCRSEIRSVRALIAKAYVGVLRLRSEHALREQVLICRLLRAQATPGVIDFTVSTRLN